MMKNRFALAAGVVLLAAASIHAQGPLRRLLYGRPAPLKCAGPDCPAGANAPPPAAAAAPKHRIVGQALVGEPPAADEKPCKAFCALVRKEARVKLREQGKSFLEAWEISGQLTDGVIAAALPDAAAIAGESLGKFGDGTILQKILDFFKTPQGQSILKVLLDLLLHAFGGPAPTPPMSQSTFGGSAFAAGCPPHAFDLAA